MSRENETKTAGGFDIRPGVLVYHVDEGGADPKNWWRVDRVTPPRPEKPDVVEGSNVVDSGRKFYCVRPDLLRSVEPNWVSALASVGKSHEDYFYATQDGPATPVEFWRVLPDPPFRNASCWGSTPEGVSSRVAMPASVAALHGFSFADDAGTERRFLVRPDIRFKLGDWIAKRGSDPAGPRYYVTGVREDGFIWARGPAGSAAEWLEVICQPPHLFYRAEPPGFAPAAKPQPSSESADEQPVAPDSGFASKLRAALGLADSASDELVLASIRSVVLTRDGLSERVGGLRNTLGALRKTLGEVRNAIRSNESDVVDAAHRLWANFCTARDEAFALNRQLAEVGVSAGCPEGSTTALIKAEVESLRRRNADQEQTIASLNRRIRTLEKRDTVTVENGKALRELLGLRWPGTSFEEVLAAVRKLKNEAGAKATENDELRRFLEKRDGQVSQLSKLRAALVDEFRLGNLSDEGLVARVRDLVAGAIDIRRRLLSEVGAQASPNPTWDDVFVAIRATRRTLYQSTLPALSFPLSDEYRVPWSDILARIQKLKKDAEAGAADSSPIYRQSLLANNHRIAEALGLVVPDRNLFVPMENILGAAEGLASTSTRLRTSANDLQQLRAALKHLFGWKPADEPTNAQLLREIAALGEALELLGTYRPAARQ